MKRSEGGNIEMKIKVIIPNSGMPRETLDAREAMLSRAVSPDTRISVDCIPEGPVSIESNTDEVLAAPLLLRMGRQAEQEGYEALVVYCFSDLAVDALREQLRIPVTGPGETALAAADMLSNRFTVITTTGGNISRTRRRLLKNHVCREKMTSVRALDIPVADLREDPDATRRYLEQVCLQAMEEEGIDTVVLGCLGMAQYGGAIEEKTGLRVIDPAFLAVAWAELAARLGLRHGPRSYAPREGL